MRSNKERSNKERSNGRPNGRPNNTKGSARRILDRLRALSSGGRILFFRRASAIVLALFAGMLALQPRQGPAAAEVPVLTIARDLPSGHVLARTDVLLRPVPADLAPKGTLREASAVDGRVLSAAARSGEILTDTRLVGPELTRLTTGEDGHAAVAVRLAEPDVADLLHPGRRVDIVTTSSPEGGTSVLAENAPVIAVRPAGDQREQGRLVLIGLPRTQATEVAAASVTHSLTVTLR